MKIIFFIFGVLFISSCGEDGFKKYEKLESFRVLAIVADTPEVSDNQASVSLTPIVSDIENGGRQINVEIVGCLDPGISRGAEVSCEGQSFRQEFVYNGGVAVDLGANLGGSLFTGAIPSVDVSIPADFLSGKSIFEQFNGVDYLLIFKFLSSGEELITTFKRIKVSTRPTKNVNPTLGVPSSLQIESGDQILEVTNSSAKETFDFYSLSGKFEQKDEVMYLSWFTSNGVIENSQIYSGEASNITFDSSLPNEAVIVVVLRDGRGGADFSVIYLN